MNDTYFISDIHGYYNLFLRLLDKINFSDSDTIIICGDIIDKGPNSLRLLDYVMHLKNVRMILGNHEYDFLKTYHGMMESFEGNSYDVILERLKRNFFPDEKENLTWDMVDWIEDLPSFIEEDDFVCVHSGAPTEDNILLPLENARIENLVYDRRFKDEDFVIKDSKCVLFGHTPTRYIRNGDDITCYNRPEIQAPKTMSDFYKIHLDTGVYLSGKLGCLSKKTLKAIYIEK